MAGQNISHEGHRQRMRTRVEQYGLESLAPHEVLEYLLYITNARRDTNGIAHALLERFGSFTGVLEASEEELCSVAGIGPASARMLHLLPEVSRYYEHDRTSTEGALTTTERLVTYLKPRFAGARQEEYPVQQVAVTYPIGEKEVKDAVKELNPDTDSLGSRG